MDLDRVADACGFRFDPQFVAARNDQQASVAAGVLERNHHERVDQFLQVDFAGHRLRHFHDGGELQLLDRRPDRSVGLWRLRLLPQIGMGLVQMADLAVGAPAQIAGPRVPKVRVGNCCQIACRIEARCELVGDSFVLNEAVLACKSDGSFVKRHRVLFPAFQARDFGADQRCAVGEILGAVLCPKCNLPVMGEERLKVRASLVGRRRVTRRRSCERAMEVVFGRLEIRQKRR